MDEGKKMPKKIRKSIAVGQIALLELGLFLFWLAINAFLEPESYNPSYWYMAYYYLSMAPLQVVLLGIFCIIGAILLFPIVRYEVKEVKEDEAKEDKTRNIVCPNCRQRILEGSKFCNNCGHKIKYTQGKPT